jgi:molecular chaperone GrpE
VSKEQENEILDDAQSIGEELPEVEEAGEESPEAEVVEMSMEQELADAKAEAAAQKDKMMRIAAEFENYKKRMMREKTMAMKYAGEPIFREVLATVDNLERAIIQGETEGVDADKGLAALLEGVQLTLKSLLTTLTKFEVVPMESVGDPFDPSNHEALTMEPSDSVPENHVLTEFEKGYQYKDRLLRAAKVIVSAGDKK